ncbi:Gfo/Idh/MocA family oxidoreductase [Actinoallomurus sp. NBC_01490]|uniref:Gfo/Idh/MocA family protein n=1 Tax=Actinoallomurus sp. NBC_01490 TaxID=2903557 RepID=UPI002E370E6E|nr:Gfo/Idh/MocA family oxidoreductase [Actinoallomurus sp. NBC_01490]
MKAPVQCAIVGCGMIADEYAHILRQSPAVQLLACSDLDDQRAHAFAERHDIPHAAPLDDLLSDDRIELLVVLTPPETHRNVAAAAVTAGACTYVEKPLALTGDNAAELLALAEQHGCQVGAAPDTFLAPPTQTAAAAVEAGLIGEPLAASAALLTSGPERWHPAPEGLYAPGMGPLADMGPYYLAQLIHLLGPIQRVDGVTATTRPRRVVRSGPRKGHIFQAQALTHVDAVLRTTGGVTITFTTSSDVHASTRPHLEIYGSEGTLLLPDPNFHHGAVRLRNRSQNTWHDLPQADSRWPVGRGMGVLDLANAMRTGRPHAATGDLALHTCRVTDAIRHAAETSAAAPVTLDAPASRPQPRGDRS